jgi:hypothetical protein
MTIIEACGGDYLQRYIDFSIISIDFSIMKHVIEVDEEVFERLRNEADQRLETPNTVLRRILNVDPEPVERRRKLDINRAKMYAMASYDRKPPRDIESASLLFDSPKWLDRPAPPLPELPHHLPATLEHTLQMIHLVKREGYTRIDATKTLADWHRVAIPTITIKFTRLLGISAHEIDALLEPGREGDLQGLLLSNFPEYGEVIRETLRFAQGRPNDT